MSDCDSTQARTDFSASSSSEKINEDGNEYRFLPSSLASEELQLALNKEANEEQLESAITRCKELVLESDQFSTERKWLVRHLIELRLRLQEFKEAQLDPQHPYNKCNNSSILAVRGHHFVLQPLLQLSSSLYCDHCTGTIW
ncbi:differentially expressed in FDCP 8 homolog [Agrilus planipennis]|uniref:Differentially expressed in FDCP 8 homolog n=1 Tax=Agrilus planipennis TaxID=224129 RepID=A0A1W4WL22_AGRPL|nr:differentially expressed in FDCP 8 homolog [Agrilus planipennis]XP_018324637.1 differentially expressed in FDCP 8 homolog [Agrilus planipennis]